MSRGGSRHHQHRSIASLSICTGAGLAPTITGKSYPQGAVWTGTATTSSTITACTLHVLVWASSAARYHIDPQTQQLCSSLSSSPPAMANQDPASSQCDSCEQGTHLANSRTKARIGRGDWLKMRSPQPPHARPGSWALRVQPVGQPRAILTSALSRLRGRHKPPIGLPAQLERSPPRFLLLKSRGTCPVEVTVRCCPAIWREPVRGLYECSTSVLPKLTFRQLD